MLKNYIKIAWRNLTRKKSYAAINIGGLTVALTVFIIIMLFVRHELSYDSFFKKSGRTYRVLMKDNSRLMTNGGVHTQLPEPIVGQLRELYPEVEDGVRYSLPRSNILIEGDQKVYSDKWARAEENFFSIFEFPFIKGDPASALSQPNNVVVTKDLAIKLFGTSEIIGRSITYNTKDIFTVTGVIENLPSNTHFEFEALAGREDYPVDQQPYSLWNYWFGPGYITLNSASQLEQFRDKLPGYVEKYKNLPEFSMDRDYELILQPVADIHLYPMGRQAGSSRMIYIRILLIVAGLILLVACINYINLATAHSAERAREIGIRKTLGAGRGQIISQVTMESIITCSAAFIGSLLLVEVVNPVVLNYFNVELSSLFTFSWGWIGILSATLVFVGIISGSYAALYLSSFHPSRILRGAGLQTGKSSPGLRKGLVVAQFGISIAIVIVSLLITQQMEFIRTERLDGHDDQVMVIHNNSQNVQQKFATLKEELLRNSNVISVTAGTLPNQISSKVGFTDSTGEATVISNFTVEYDYLKTMGLKLKDGRTFDPKRSIDSSESIILNETAARVFGYEEANGQSISLFNRQLIGIVEDFHETTLFDPIQPVMLRSFQGSRSRMATIMVRLQEGGISSGIEHVHSVWDQFEPAYPLNYSFLDQIMDQDYQAELRLAKIFNVFSGFSIFIACLGLFGLAAYSAERRTKEIGIRKVLGATISGIVGLLSKDFLRLVALGFIIAIPVAWHGANWWLQDFAYRIEIRTQNFHISGCICINNRPGHRKLAVRTRSPGQPGGEFEK